MSWNQYVQGGRRDMALRNELLTAEMSNVRKLAKQHAHCIGKPEMADDFISLGYEAMISMARTYDPDYGNSFWVYARVRALGAMRDYLRRIDPLTRSQREQVKYNDRVKTSAQHDLGRAASMEEMEASGVHAACQNEFLFDDLENFVDRSGDYSSSDELNEFAKTMLDHISMDDAVMLWMWAVRGARQKDIGAALGVGGTAVCNRITAARKTLKRHLSVVQPGQHSLPWEIP